MMVTVLMMYVCEHDLRTSFSYPALRSLGCAAFWNTLYFVCVLACETVADSGNDLEPVLSL